MSFLLEELGYRLGDDERFKLYLTNTLEMEDLEQTALPGMATLAEESHLAGKVKKKTPILVILGNPPYSGHSANKGKWISKEIREYYRVDGKPLDEKNPKWLQDDYVKFIRFAQWKIDQTGEGVLGFITNHGYLDNPTFRGMRQSLMNSFNEIYLLDLHGNSLKKEKCPDGSKDENVFDIRQGVCIGLFVKKKQNEGTKVLHADLWDLREDKYRWLSENDIKTTEWEEAKPHSELYLFALREEALLEEYKSGWKITDIMPVNSVGIVTARDGLTIQKSPEKVWETVRDFSSLPEDIARNKYDLGKDTRDWKVSLAQKDLRKSALREELIVPILYRPFDMRWTYYTGHSRGFICRPRPEVMQHMMEENLGFVGMRQYAYDVISYNYVFVSDKITESRIFISNKGIANIFPLYLYDKNNVKKPNLNPDLIQSLTKTYGKEPTPEEIFYYIYAVLYSNTYRTKYAEFLKTDFPRVPFTQDHDLFKEMSKLGKNLVDLHLMRSDALDDLIAKFQGISNNRVERWRYDEKEKRVYINKGQYFEGIERDVWEYQIGGYQVLDKWLKGRKGRELSLEDIKHYCRVATVLKKTREVQKEIDRLYPHIEEKVIEE
jgi:predicted helicase